MSCSWRLTLLSPWRGDGGAASQGEGSGFGGGAHIREATVTLLAGLHELVPADGGQRGQAGQPFKEAAAHPFQKGFLQGLPAAVAEVQAWQEAGEGGKKGGGCRVASGPDPPLPRPHCCRDSLRGGLHDAALGRGRPWAGAAAPRQVVVQAQAVAQLVRYRGGDPQDAGGMVLALGRGYPRSSSSLSAPVLSSSDLRALSTASFLNCWPWEGATGGVPREGGHHSSGHIIQPCPHTPSSGVGHSVGASVTPRPSNWVALTWK